MRKRLLSGLVLWSLALAAGRAAPEPVLRGQIDLPWVTGAAALRGDRLLLTTSRPNGIVVLDGALSRLQSGQITVAPSESLRELLRGKVDLDDLQDAAWDGSGSAYVVSSHGRTALGEAPEQRYRLARLRFDATGKVLEVRQSDALLQALVNDVPFLADSVHRPPARAGLNVGGLAWTPERHLLVGLRSPTVTESQPRPHGGQEDAVVVRVKNPEELFLLAPRPAQLGDVVKVDLRGQGIHGMCYDPARKAFWLLSGLSPAPNHRVKSPWALWLWDGSGPRREARLPEGTGLENPSGVCLVEGVAEPRLLLVEPGPAASRYALFSVPALATAAAATRQPAAHPGDE